VTPSPYRTATAEQQAADHRDACKASIVFLLIMALMFTCGYVVGAQWGAHDEPYMQGEVDHQRRIIDILNQTIDAQSRTEDICCSRAFPDAENGARR
jgi:hypothetical protein